MSIKHFIKNYLLEQDDSIVQVTPDEYIELLDNVGGIASRIPMLKPFKGKQIVITGPLNLSNFKTIGPLTGIERVMGRLDVSYTNVPNLNGIQVDGYTNDYGSVMWRTKLQAELNRKLGELAEKRQENEWDVDNEDDESERTEALYKHLKRNGDVDTYEDEEGNEKVEDKYFIYPNGRATYGYGKQYEWLGGLDAYNPNIYDVYTTDEIDAASKYAVEQLIDDVGQDAFVDWVWDEALDNEQWSRWLRDFYYDIVNDDPDNYEIPLTLSSEQQKRVTQLESTIASLTQKLNNENLPEDQQKEIKTKIYGLGDIIQDIKDEPEGDYDEDYANSIIDDYVSQYDDDIRSFITDYGWDKSLLMDFIDTDKVVESVVNHDGYGNLVSPYDGEYDEFNINGTTYYVVRSS